MNVHAPALAKAHRLRRADLGVCRRRDRRPVAASEAAVAEIFLRRHGIGAVRADHGACRNIIRPAPSSAILRDRGDEIAAIIPKGAALVEFGAGATTKVRLLLERCDFGAYVPVDISGDFLNAQADALRKDFPVSTSIR